MSEPKVCAFCGGESDDFATLQMRIELAEITKARHKYPLCYKCARDTKGSEIVSKIVPTPPADMGALVEALGEDASGRPFPDLLRLASQMLNWYGGGPVADCLALKAEQVEAALSHLGQKEADNA